MELKFRHLRADEVECRVATVSGKGCSLLLYKDARCDQNILDESVGAMNWQRHHSRDNANCIVSIWDEDKKIWIEKEDTGTESYTEKEKGLASDSFKRACFNWGIGRELYTAPFIWIKTDGCNLEEKNGKPTTYDKFSVKEMTVVDGKIVSLSIANLSKPFDGKIVYTAGKPKSVDSPKPAPQTTEQQDAEATAKVEKTYISATKATSLANKAKTDGVPLEKIYEKCRVKSLDRLTEKQFAWICATWTQTFLEG